MQGKLVTQFLGEVWQWLEELSHNETLVIVHCKSALGMEFIVHPIDNHVNHEFFQVWQRSMACMNLKE